MLFLRAQSGHQYVMPRRFFCYIRFFNGFFRFTFVYEFFFFVPVFLHYLHRTAAVAEGSRSKAAPSPWHTSCCNYHSSVMMSFVSPFLINRHNRELLLPCKAVTRSIFFPFPTAIYFFTALGDNCSSYQTQLAHRAQTAQPLVG